MSYVTDVFSLDADETVFNMNNNSWLTHVDTNNTVSAPFHEPSTSSNNELTEITIIRIGVLALHYVEF